MSTHPSGPGRLPSSFLTSATRRSPTSSPATRPRCSRPAASTAAGRGGIAPARHHDRVADLRRRHRHGRRPPRHHGQPHRLARHREGLPGRRPLVRRHRRHRRHRDRAGPAVPGRARALREDRGHPALARRQGQPARVDDPRQPRRWRCRAWPSCRCSPATTSTPATAASSATTSPAAATRSTQYHSVGSGSVFAKGALKKLYRDEPRPTPTPSSRASRRSTTPPTRTPPPAVPTSPAGIYPVVAVVDADGYRRLADDELGPVVARRRGRLPSPAARAPRRTRLAPSPAILSTHRSS